MTELLVKCSKQSPAHELMRYLRPRRQNSLPVHHFPDSLVRQTIEILLRQDHHILYGRDHASIVVVSS